MVNFNDNISTAPAQIRLDDFAYEIVTRKSRDLGYPTNQKSLLVGFYKWLWGSGLNLAMVNNAGDPFDGKNTPIRMHWSLNGKFWNFSDPCMGLIRMIFGE
ncbi:MAG: hypothetical protein K6E62_05270 [Lachnospiraceae bacterium]|nr:hypothetical protein [Lachnospiraceae bacterium]